MTPELVFWPGSRYGEGFDALLDAAAAAGFAAMAVSTLMLEQLLSAGRTATSVLRDASTAGLTLSQLDGMSSWAPVWYGDDVSPALRERFDCPAARCLELATEFQLEAVVAVGVFDRGELGRDVLVDAFGAFCDAAVHSGQRVDLEPIPYWGVPDLATAWDIVAGAGRSNGGILVDTWHLQKGSRDLESDLELLAGIPAACLTNVQLADAAVAAEADTLRAEGQLRRFPGDGELALERIVSIIAGKGGLRWIGAELAGTHIDGLPIREAARRCAESTKDTLTRCR